MPHTYAIEIFYSDEDEGFIAVVPELAGCSAFGETEEEALSGVKAALGLRLDTARKEGREIPEPGGREHLGGYSCGEGCPPRTDGVINTPCANRHSPEHNKSRNYFFDGNHTENRLE